MGIRSFFKSLLRGNGQEEMAGPQRIYKSAPTVYSDSSDGIDRWDEGYSDSIYPASSTPANDLRDFLALYGGHPWAYACINAIATAASSIPYQVLQGKEETTEHPVLAVLARPNRWQVWAEYIEAHYTFMEACGNSFWEEVRDEKGDLRALYLLRPDKMKIIPHPKYKVAGYVYEPKQGREIYFDPSEITHIKYFNPLDDYWGMGPGYPGQNSIILDLWSTNYNKKFFKNFAVPEGVLETEGTLSDTAYKRIRADWMKRHRGIENAFELAILEEGLKYRPIGFNQRDMQMQELKSLSREEILAVWRVPPIMVGLLEGHSRASASEQKKMFWMDNVIPKHVKLQGIVNENIMPKGVTIQFVTKSITSIIEDSQVASSIATSQVSHGIMTINETRMKYHGLPPVPWGDKWWAPVGLAPVDSGVHPQTPQPDHMGQPERLATQTPEQALNQSTPMKRDTDFEKIAMKDPDWDSPGSVRLWKSFQFWKAAATPDYKSLVSLFKKFFSEQMDRVTSSWELLYPVKKKDESDQEHGDDHFEEVAKDLMEVESAYDVYKTSHFDPDVERMLFKLSDEDKKLKLTLFSKIEKILKKHGKIILGELGVKASFDLKDPRVEKFLKNFGAQNIGGINKTTREILGQSLSKAIEKGEDFKEVMERVREVMKGDLAESRARKIAQTEVVTLTQFARLEGAKQTGIVEKKQWISELLNTTRHSHEQMHGVTVGIDEVFRVKSRDGVDEMQGPGDPDASAENVVNCYCFLDYPSATPEFQDLEEPQKEQPTVEE